MKVSEIENNLNNLADFYIDRSGDEEYEKHLKVLIIKNFEKLQAENKKLREALEKYANKIDGTAGLEIISETGQEGYVEEFGSLARLTLKKLEGER